MKRLVLVVVAALAFAPAASAKEILGLKLCGPDGCAQEKGSNLREGPAGPLGDGPSAPPAAPGSWYRGELLIGDSGQVHGHFAFYYVPGGTIVRPGMLGQATTWVKATGAWRRALDAAAARVEPFPKPKLDSVTLNGRHAHDPQSYLDLYTIGGKPVAYPKHLDSIQIAFESKRRTPWTDGNYVALYPKDGLLVRDGQLVQISRDVADRVAAGRSLDVGKSFPWMSLLAGLAVIALVLGAVFALPRGGTAREPVPQA